MILGCSLSQPNSTVSRTETFCQFILLTPLPVSGLPVTQDIWVGIQLHVHIC